MTIKIYHNPRCSKSRATLALLKERNLEPEVIEYLKTPPDRATLEAIVAGLDAGADALFRRGDADYKAAAQELSQLSEAAQLEWLSQHPAVIERPIVVTGKGARIGRPPENVLDIIN